MKVFTVLVTGSRHWNKFEVVYQMLLNLKKKYAQDGDVVLVVHGAAAGADCMAGDAADKLHLPCMSVPADWPKLGKKAGPIRNQLMLDLTHPNLVLAFHADLAQSKGTKDMVGRAKRAGIEVVLSKD
jgi:hypothetical protein